MSAEALARTAYELLGVDPSAPPELVAAVYWMDVSELQTQRTAGQPVDALLHSITRSYETISDPLRRAQYDSEIGNDAPPVMMRKLSAPRRSFLRRLFSRRPLSRDIDLYEIIGLAPAAEQAHVEEAYRVMRDVYLRAPSRRQRHLLMRLLDDAHQTLADADARAAYDSRRAKKAEAAVAVAAPPPITTPQVEAPPPEAAPTAAPEREPVAIVTAVAEPAAAPAPTEEAEPAEALVARAVAEAEPLAEIPSAPVEAPVHIAQPKPAGRSPLRTTGVALGSTLGLLGRALLAVGRASLGAVKAGAGKLRSARGTSATPASRPVSTPKPAQPAAISPPAPVAPRRKRPDEVEEAFLDRLASRVQNAGETAPPPE